MNNKLAKRWSKVEGVVFPKTDLSTFPKGFNTATKSPYEQPLKGYISTAEAAELLGSQRSATCVKLHRRKVKFILVLRPEKGIGGTMLYWWRESVLRIAQELPPFATAEELVDMMSMQEVMNLTGLKRSTLIKASKKGRLMAHMRRIMTQKGPQSLTFFDREEVVKYIAWRKHNSWWSGL